MKIKILSVFFLFIFFLWIFSIPNVFSTGPDVNNFSATFDQAYVKNGSITFTFNVLDLDVNRLAGADGAIRDLNAQIWLVKDYNANRTDYLGDWNLMGSGDKFATCTGDFNAGAGSSCSITYTLAETTDGNYWFDMNVYDYNSGNSVIVDSNTVRSQDYDLNFYIDNTSPTTAWDGNHNTWQNGDANIHLTCVDAGSCAGGDANLSYRLDTDSSTTITYGPWLTYDTNVQITADGNWAVDFNSTDYAGNVGDTNTFYALIDQTAPVVTITNPTDGSSQLSTGVTLTYTATNIGNIAKYYVQVDSNGWIDNSTNTSYDFNNLTKTSHTFYVIAQTTSDVNSTTASVTTTVSSAPDQEGGTNYCDAQGGDICEENETCSGSWWTAQDSDRCCSVECTVESVVEEVCGNGTCAGDENASNCPADCPTETKETVLEKVISKKPTAEEIREKLTEAGASENAIEKASQAVGKTTVSRTITVEKITNNITGEITYETTMTISVSNQGKKKMQKIKVIENLPKSVALSASEIKSNTEFTILKDDPIIQFEINEIIAGNTKTISYTVNNEVDTTTANQMTTPIVLEFQEVDPPVDLCKGKDCDDLNPCTTDSCDSLTGECFYSNLADKTDCGTDKECKTGACVAKATTGNGDNGDKDEEDKGDFTPYILIAVLIIIVGAIAYYYIQQKKI